MEFQLRPTILSDQTRTRQINPARICGDADISKMLCALWKIACTTVRSILSPDFNWLLEWVDQSSDHHESSRPSLQCVRRVPSPYLPNAQVKRCHHGSSLCLNRGLGECIIIIHRRASTLDWSLSPCPRRLLSHWCSLLYFNWSNCLS